MILQSLVRLYDQLAEKGVLERPGWLPVPVSLGLLLGEDGSLIDALSLMYMEKRGQTSKMVARKMNLPAPVKRTVAVDANFVCDNAAYILGIDTKGKPERALKCFEASRELHKTILLNVDHPAARAIRAFFETWRPEKAQEHPAISAKMDQLASANLTFLFGDDLKPVSEIPAISDAWDACYADSEAARIRCLATGETGPLAVLHPSLKGIVGAQSSGASLVSFNARAYESFGHEQGMVAPVCERAAFAYGAALNYLLSSRDHRIRVGDATVVFWAEGAEKAYDDIFLSMMGGDSDVQQEDLVSVMKAISQGRSIRIRETLLRPDNRYYVLGLSPNASRVSVRFFVANSFGKFVQNIIAHEKRLEIVRPIYEKDTVFYPWRLLGETVNQKARDKSPSPQLAGDLFRAILNDTAYPATLMNLVELRVRAERRVTFGRASIIKAYLLKNTQNTANYLAYKEALENMELNDQTTYLPYVLGRLFSVLEDLQTSANPTISATIRDRFFNSACATPAIVFPQLINLSNAHLKKVTSGKESYYKNMIKTLMDKITSEYPRRLNLYDQGIFQIGYYHQTQKRYEKKGDKENG